MKKTYIIVGSNNFWYTQIECKPENLEKELADLSKEIKDGNYSDENFGTPDKIYAYPIGGKETVLNN